MKVDMKSSIKISVRGGNTLDFYKVTIFFWSYVVFLAIVSMTIGRDHSCTQNFSYHFSIPQKIWCSEWP